MSNFMVISTAVAPVHREPRFSSEMITQALLWEKVEIIQREKLWFNIRQEDGYCGWIYAFYLLENSETFENWLTIQDRFVSGSSINENDGGSMHISFGTRLPVQAESASGITVSLPGKHSMKISCQNRKSDKSRNQIEKFAKSLLGTPYIWGGKSAYGFDCSGFVQLVLKTAGIAIARDTNRQLETPWLKEIDSGDSKPGDLHFFAENKQINHVGFSLGKGKIIHCSGEVKIESINEGDEGFNQWLCQSFFNTFSISKDVVD